jgi:hypothetical protein
LEILFILQFITIPQISPSFRTFLFKVGSIQGNPMQIGQTFLFGSSASSTAFLQEQNIFVADFILM